MKCKTKTDPLIWFRCFWISFLDPWKLSGQLVWFDSSYLTTGINWVGLAKSLKLTSGSRTLLMLMAKWPRNICEFACCGNGLSCFAHIQAFTKISRRFHCYCMQCLSTNTQVFIGIPGIPFGQNVALHTILMRIRMILCEFALMVI